MTVLIPCDIYAPTFQFLSDQFPKFHFGDNLYRLKNGYLIEPNLFLRRLPEGRENLASTEMG